MSFPLSVQGHSEAVVSVLFEPRDGSPHYYRTYRRIRNLAGFKARRIAEAPECRVSFGAPIWSNHYGAH